jgi:hypothetical protein
MPGPGCSIYWVLFRYFKSAGSMVAIGLCVGMGLTSALAEFFYGLT